MKIKLSTLECERCGHKWHPKKEEMPRCCAFCKSPYWNVPTEKTSKLWERHEKECELCGGL